MKLLIEITEYNKEWIENASEIPQEISAEIADAICNGEPKTGWIPVSEGLPEEHEWIGTKKFGTTISDKVHITFDVNGERFVKTLCLQNGELSDYEKRSMDAFHEGWKMIAWMSLPEPYREDYYCKPKQKTGKWKKTKYGYTWIENNVCLNFVDYYDVKEDGE